MKFRLQYFYGFFVSLITHKMDHPIQCLIVFVQFSCTIDIFKEIKTNYGLLRYLLRKPQSFYN